MAGDTFGCRSEKEKQAGVLYHALDICCVVQI
jgi:hypothetical protein